MNKVYLSIKSIAVLLFLTSQYALGWGTDKVIFNGGPSAQHSMAAKQNGVLYAAMPGVGFSGPNLVTIFTSIDNGDTWFIAPIGGLPVTAPVVKTKMVRTGSDSIYCLFLQDNYVYMVNVESGVLGQMTQLYCKDFDAVASPNGNWIYVWGSNVANNNIRRYGTADGGLSWAGDSASVTSNGAYPRVTMWGSRAILNYYGPVLPDTATSVIRAAFYDEVVPGDLQAGTFQDVALNTGIRRKQFKTTLVNATAWFVFTEGDAQQVIKCRVTQDDGVTYQPEFTIYGNATVNTKWFDIASYSSTVGDGMTMTCLADSVAPVIPSFDKMLFLSASTLTPSGVTIYPPPYNTYNDTSVTFAADNVLPVIVNLNTGFTSEAAIAWVGDSPGGPWLYFDRRDAIVGLIDEHALEESISVYPSPADEVIFVESNELFLGSVTIELFDVSGRKASGKTVFISNSPHMMDVSGLHSGNYLLQVTSPDFKTYRKKITIL